MSPSGENIRKP